MGELQAGFQIPSIRDYTYTEQMGDLPKRSTAPQASAEVCTWRGTGHAQVTGSTVGGATAGACELCGAQGREQSSRGWSLRRLRGFHEGKKARCGAWED